MPSNSYRRWRTTRGRALDEVAQAHAAVGGTARGRRFTTQQINRAYAVLLASHFQGFCRDLHSECVEHLLMVLAPPPSLRKVVRAEFVRGRQLDRGNAQPSSLGADFGRLEISLWTKLAVLEPMSVAWKDDVEMLNEWRNAIVHQDFTSAKLCGIINLRLIQVRQWRRSCNRLAKAMDRLMFLHLQALTGLSPW
jgi:hypothetical protein